LIYLELLLLELAWLKFRIELRAFLDLLFLKRFFLKQWKT
jgi:hypothetical protein